LQHKILYTPYRCSLRGLTEEKMLNKILSLFTIDRRSILESYIASRQPLSRADVERMIKEFERHTSFNY